MIRFGLSVVILLWRSANCRAWTGARQGSLMRTPTPSGTTERSRLFAFSMEEEEASFADDSSKKNGIEEKLSDKELLEMAGEWDERIARFNTVFMIGRIGSNPEPKYFDDGKVVVNLSLATKRRHHWMERKMLDIKYGEEETDWFGLEIWGQTAEFVAKYVDKGARVSVVGQLQLDEWTDKATGEPRNRAKIVVRDLDLLETKAEAELRRSGSRKRSFYTDDDEGDDFRGSSRTGGSGGFFDYS